MQIRASYVHMIGLQMKDAQSVLSLKTAPSPLLVTKHGFAEPQTICCCCCNMRYPWIFGGQRQVLSYSILIQGSIFLCVGGAKTGGGKKPFYTRYFSCLYFSCEMFSPFTSLHIDSCWLAPVRLKNKRINISAFCLFIRFYYYFFLECCAGARFVILGGVSDVDLALEAEVIDLVFKTTQPLKQFFRPLLPRKNRLVCTLQIFCGAFEEKHFHFFAFCSPFEQVCLKSLKNL